MILKDSNITLRPLRISDSKNYLDCHNDKEAKLNFSSVPKNLNEAKKEIEKEKTLNKKFAIIVKGIFVGFINLRLNKNPRYKHSGIIGYGIKKDYRKKGYATSAVKLVTNYAFKELYLKRISGVCRSFNKSSARVLEKAGYKHEGTLKKNKLINGKYLDDMIWAKVK